MHRISVQNQFIQSNSQPQVFSENLQRTTSSWPASVQDKSFLESYLQSFKLTLAGKKKAKNSNAVLKNLTVLLFKTKFLKNAVNKFQPLSSPKPKLFLQALSYHSGDTAALSHIINMHVAIQSEDPRSKQQGSLFQINYLLLVL